MSVRRKIFKARFAQKKKFLLHIMKVKKLPKKRIYFLVSPIESEENTT